MLTGIGRFEGRSSFRTWLFRILSQEIIATVEQAAVSLPAAQRAFVILRDVVGCDAHEVCDVLGITGTNQRVLLHRARTKVRSALEQRLASSQP